MVELIWEVQECRTAILPAHRQRWEYTSFSVEHMWAWKLGQHKTLVLWKKVPGQVRELKACSAQGTAAGSESRLCSELLGTPRLSLAQSPAAPRGARGGVGATSPAVAVTCRRGQSQSALALPMFRTVVA